MALATVAGAWLVSRWGRRDLALQAAFPPFLAGRYSGGYYGASVALR